MVELSLKICKQDDCMERKMVVVNKKIAYDKITTFNSPYIFNVMFKNPKWNMQK